MFFRQINLNIMFCDLFLSHRFKLLMKWKTCRCVQTKDVFDTFQSTDEYHKAITVDIYQWLAEAHGMYHYYHLIVDHLHGDI